MLDKTIYRMECLKVSDAAMRCAFFLFKFSAIVIKSGISAILSRYRAELPA